MGDNVGAGMGILTGKGQVHDKDGNLKGEFTITSEPVSLEVAQKVCADNGIELKQEQDNGGNPPDGGS